MFFVLKQHNLAFTVNTFTLSHSTSVERHAPIQLYEGDTVFEIHFQNWNWQMFSLIIIWIDKAVTYESKSHMFLKIVSNFEHFYEENNKTLVQMCWQRTDFEIVFVSCGLE